MAVLEDVAVSEVVLDEPGIGPLVGQRVAAGVAQHVRVRFDRPLGEPRLDGPQFIHAKGGVVESHSLSRETWSTRLPDPPGGAAARRLPKPGVRAGTSRG